MDESAHDSAPRVLVVDDEQMIREILADFLSLEGFRVRTAPNGREALRELELNEYDLVLSDLKMPEMGGLELLEHLRARWPRVVTVIMTAFGTVETAIDAMKRGAYDYVLKPFRIEEVVHLLQRGLEKRRLEAENMRLKEALSLYKVGEAIAASLSLEEVLTTVGDAAVHDVDADLTMVAFRSQEGAFFERMRRVGRSFVEHATALQTLELDLESLGDHFRSESVLNVSGPRVVQFFSAPSERFVAYALMATPLRVRNEVVGYVVVVGLQRARRFDEGQRKLLHAIGSRAAAAIENARLYEDLQATFNQTIQGLARAIDKMDRYTAGHSDRVAYYAALLAKNLGLAADDIEIVRQAALMHDIGKIGCVLNLNRPGQLSPQEYAIFKQHPGFGREILEPIKFLHKLVPGVYCHHERWDGKGYPVGLAAKDIPLIARIISVADTYDAMTSDRSYRKALPHEVATKEISRCAGSQFDPDCAHPFLSVIEAERDERVARGEDVPE
ncbi:MAG: response regulator [Myxococcales bacterium]|nr:response regulator [Myxococcales bacterium]